ncbi:hypothetical protein [Nonomuraea cavernae]|uniref:hypothetical protein n=1 Tax=Nonomuraea cavernae TaxID=2045107 RepID=UPI0033F0924B
MLEGKARKVLGERVSQNLSVGLADRAADRRGPGTLPSGIDTPHATAVLYGYAWADGGNALRITPAKATMVKEYGIRRYRLTPIPGAKERRIVHSGAGFRRITAACDLKETEGVVRLDREGLGTTRCDATDLAFVLKLGPAPVRISLGATTEVREFLATPRKPRAAYGTIKRVNDTTVIFTKGRTSVRFHYTFADFHRVTRKCGDRWLADHTHADRDGLGTRACGTASFTRALKRAEYPVLAKVAYDQVSRQLLEVWEVFGDA